MVRADCGVFYARLSYISESTCSSSWMLFDLLRMLRRLQNWPDFASSSVWVKEVTRCSLAWEAERGWSLKVPLMVDYFDDSCADCS